MSETRLYLSLNPEALIFSMLAPEAFGRHLTLGTEKQSSSHALFLEVDPSVQIPGIQLTRGRERCVAHADGSPRHSAYVAIYRVLERIPLCALGKLHLTTKDGLLLSLTPSSADPPSTAARYLYQEICPVSPRVVSTLPPQDFCRYVTQESNPLFIPRIAFADMRLGALADDPQHGEAEDLPYPYMDHLRACLTAVDSGGTKKTKIERRGTASDVLFYLVGNGFYIGDQEAFLHYPMPDADALLGEHHRWWNSAAKTDRY